MAHRDLKPLAGKHRPGCLTGHENRYIAGNTCSYRWHAARRARSDPRIQYPMANRSVNKEWKRTKAQLDKLESWVRHGKASRLRVGDKTLKFSLGPFTTGWWPWKNQVHHIIPHGSLLDALGQIADQAEPRQVQTFDVMKDGLYDEPYNINDEPNVLVLPLRNADAEAMGLPRHLLGSGGGACQHRDYSTAVQQELHTRIGPHYEGLIAAIRSKKHQEHEEVPAVRPVLEQLSMETYEEILSKTAVVRERGSNDVCLDDIAPLLYR